MHKIAFVSTMANSPWGGSEELWSQAALRLRERGVEVDINVPWWPEMPAPLKKLEKAGCIITRRQSGGLQRRIANKFKPQQEFRWLDRIQPHLVVVSQGGVFDGLEWRQACTQRNLPCAPIVQCAAECFWPPDDYAEQQAQTYKQAAGCYFVSHANLKLACQQIAIELPNAKVVWNPFIVSYDVASTWPEDDEVLQLACVARLEPKAKGQDVLFEVLSDEKWRKRPLQVTLIGNGENRRTLTDLKTMYGLDNLHFGGFVSNIEAMWASHHALILPSRFEGLPLALVEAMLCGRTSIVTDVAGNTELVEDNVSGFVAAAPTPALLDEAMERAWNRRSEWREMGIEAANRARQLVPRDPAAEFADHLMSHLPR